MIWNQLTSVLNQLQLNTFSLKDDNPDTVYLTFDDGPNKKTKDLFNFLDTHHISATHFWLFNQQDELYKNHSKHQRIAFHGFNHIRYFKITKNETINQIENCLTRSKLFSIIVDPYFRPPYGSFNLALQSQLKEKKLKLIFWSHIVNDYNLTFKPESVTHLLDNLVGGSIIVLHDHEQFHDRVCQTVNEIQKIVKQKKMKLTCLPF